MSKLSKEWARERARKYLEFLTVARPPGKVATTLVNSSAKHFLLGVRYKHAWVPTSFEFQAPFSTKPSISTHSKPRTMPCTRLLKCFVMIALCCKTKPLRSLVEGIVRGFEWVEILGFTVLIYIVQLNWRWLMMHERSMKKEPWPKSHKWRCFKHFHGFKNRLAWAKTVRIFTKGGLQQLSAQAQQVSRIEQQDYTGHGKPFTLGPKYWNPWDLNSK